MRNGKAPWNSERYHTKANTVLKTRNISLETKKRVMNSYVISISLNGKECWTISSHMNRRFVATDLVLQNFN